MLVKSAANAFGLSLSTDRKNVLEEPDLLQNGPDHEKENKHE